jgi:hypothetical protein
LPVDARARLEEQHTVSEDFTEERQAWVPQVDGVYLALHEEGQVSSQPLDGVLGTECADVEVRCAF